jgi:glycosyltransferase involved in cell wall biosynthesis
MVNGFLVPHLLGLRREYAVSLTVPQSGEVPLAPLPGVEVIPLEIRRRIAPWRDLRSAVRLLRLFRARRFDLVHSFGPKAGLLAMLAGALAGPPVRLHTFTGQVWAARTGASRALLKMADRLTAALATRVLADSASQREFMVREGVVAAGKCEVLGHGSLSGVDLRRFKPDAEARAAVRAELGIGEGAVVVLFLGRIARDKGVLDLADAFGALGTDGGRRLLLVGPDEEGLGPEIERRVLGYTARPERYLAAADLLCLPSYREGFGSVIIEAAASGVPAVASRIYGVTDAVVEGETGVLFEPGNVGELRLALGGLIGDAARRRVMAEAARARASADFSQERLVGALAARYREMLGS